MVRIALRPNFRYIHEPLHIDEDALSLLGNTEIIAELRDRVVNSRGGAFLVAGFRGVGKSTLVLRALEKLRRESGTAVVVLPVMLSVARSTTTDRLLFALVRRVFETLSDSTVFHRLSPDVQHSLLLAYMRTSLSFKETQTNASERGGSMELGAAASATNVVVPKVSLSAKRTRSLATEASFLAYSETDVEYDLMRIISLLNKEEVLGRPPVSGIRRLWPRRRRPPARLRLVIVLDEVDKLTAGQPGLEAIEALLAGLKNVLTMTGVHFLMIAGPDLHDRALRDVSRGNSVYESVFSWLTYVPCTWDAPRQLLDDVLAEPLSETAQADVELLVDYLRFKARGVPRRLLQEFNAFVVWHEGKPFLEFDEEERTRLAFYARLEGLLAHYFDKDRHEHLFPVSLDKDRQRLGAYYIVDWVIRSAGQPFTALDLVRQGEEADFDPLLQLPRRVVDRLLTHLVKSQVITVVRDRDISAPLIAGVAEAALTVYKLADNVTRTLLQLAVQNESERAAMEFSQLSFPQIETSMAGNTTILRSAVLRRTIAGRYELGALIGRGGMGSVFRAVDGQTGQVVAVKVLSGGVAENEQAVARFRREVDIASAVRHPQVVQTYDVVTDPDTGLALVMELLSGPTLSEVVRDGGVLTATATARLGHTLADAVAYLENRGLVRMDLKPSNVIMHPDRGPVIIDLGLARFTEREDTIITQIGAVVGTPTYMAPEQFESLPVDIRADIYAIGLLLYFSLVGNTPWEGEPMVAMMAQIVNTGLDVSTLPVSPEFRAVIARATAIDREQRFPHAVDLRAALAALPDISAPLS